MADARPGERPATSRIAALDAARGLAICGMVVYHLAWDLADRGWPVTAPRASLLWMIVGHLVAGSFLLLSGIGLAIAEPKGLRAALRRLAVVAAAAMAVTLVTFRISPGEVVLFGILHCIVVTNALGIVALRVSAVSRLLLAAAAGLAPLIPLPALMEQPSLWWLGLSGVIPATLDYRPVLPWLAPVLVGTVLGQNLGPIMPQVRNAGVHRGAVRCLARAGRHSLAVYLAHQPMLFGVLLLVGAFLPPRADPYSVARECRSDCEARGASANLCAAGCACVAARRARDAGVTTPNLDRLDAACLDPGRLDSGH